MNGISSDVYGDEGILIVTGNEILRIGMKLLGWSEKQLKRQSKKFDAKRIYWFIANFGASPLVVVHVWEAMQRTDVAAARIDNATLDELSNLLFTFHFLKAHPTEGQQQNEWHMHVCDQKLSDDIWKMLLRIQALKIETIVWPPTEEIGDTVWIGTVDSTHVKTEEPKHPKLSQEESNHPNLSKDALSYKHHAPAFVYEIVVSLWSSRIIWMRGPFLAETSGIQMFSTRGGLMKKLQKTNVKLIAHHGYRGFNEILSRPNSYDNPDVKKFKSRALMRHQAVIAKIKTLLCTDSAQFCHDMSKFKICFEASVVITQYRMEISEPVFGI